jgi:hypothetical protein
MSDGDDLSHAALTEMAKQLADAEGDVTDIEKAGGGAHDLAGKLLQHLHDRLDRRREAHGFEKRKESPPMDTTTELLKIMTDGGGPVVLCKSILARGSAPCTEHELTAAIGKAAAAASGEREDVAFAKLYGAEESVRRAINVAKAAGPMFDVTIVHPGDETRRTVNDTEQSEAYQTLQALADKLHAAATGRMTKEQAFARAFESHPDLARKAHVRPTAPANGAYPFPSAR